MMTVSRNDPCPCGSGKKYKKCCLAREADRITPRSRLLAVLATLLVILTVVAWTVIGADAGKVVGGVGVLALGAYLLFSNPPPARGGGDPSAIRFGN